MVPSTASPPTTASAVGSLPAPGVVVPAVAATKSDDLLRGAERLWRGAPAKGLQVRLFRRRIESSTLPAAVEMRIAASSYFHLWVNGRYVTRGPVFHQPGPLPVGKLDLTPYWRVGENVVAVLVHCPGFPTHQVPTGDPGLWAAIGQRDASGRSRWTVSDRQWRVSDETGWRAHAVRHGYALGPVEVLDAAAHPWGWQAPGFDDASWPRAEVLPSDDEPVVVDLPALVHGWAEAQSLAGVWEVGAEPAPLEPGQACELLGEWLQDEPWRAPTAEVAAGTRWSAGTSRLTLDNLSPDRGVAVVLDLGSEQVGNVCFELDVEADAGAGVVEIGWSEVMRDGKPEVTHKGTTYVDRLLARPGKQRWEALQFTGLRYLVLIFRGFSGTASLEHIGVRTSTSVPHIRADFTSSDERLDAIWGLCERSLRIGTQETIIDCPSREQAPYLGDGNLVGRWLGDFTGDYRHWRYLIQLGFESQAEDGLMRDAPLMPMRRSLIDYVLLTVMGLRDYLKVTGDTRFARNHLEGCRRALGYFDRRILEDNVLATSQVPGISLSVAWDIAGKPRGTESLDPHVFIDHAGGLGHNLGDPGIERHGRSGALNALYVLANEALAELEQQVGDSAQVAARRAAADRVRAAASAMYWDGQRGVFIDAVHASGKRYPQVSEQTNILAVMAGFTPPVAPPDVLRRVLEPDPSVARCGPYFCAYLLPLMARFGMHAEALKLIREKWGRMLDGGATSLWETFAGDSLDTWCHPWSAAPAKFLMRDVLGIRIDEQDPTRVALRPRYDLLERAAGHLPSPAGPIELRWETRSGRVYLRGQLPAGYRGLIHPVNAGEARPVDSTWQLEWPHAPRD